MRDERDRVTNRARGQWRSLLEGCGIPSGVLNGRHHPCPRSGDGVDRFRFTNRDGSGSYFCHCSDAAREGKAGGIGLLMCVKGLTYQGACEELERHLPAARRDAPQRQANKVWQVQQVRAAVRPVGAEVSGYLAGRGLVVPPAIRQALLPFYDGDTFVGTYQAMVAGIKAPDGTTTGVHVTYLQGTKKLAVADPRRTKGSRTGGAAIRLFDVVDDEMGIAEGIETAIAAHLMFQTPVWSCIAADGIANFVPPAGVRRVWIFGDNDANFTGQAAAYACARRLKQMELDVAVMLPPRSGEDWNDVLLQQQQKAA